MDKVLACVVVLFGLLSFAHCATPVKDCGNGVALPLQTQVNDCEQLPCPLQQGTTVELNITFAAPKYLPALTPEVIAHALGVDVNYPLPEKNGCNSLIGIRCPIEQNEIVLYNLKMPILSLYPTISLELKFTIYDEQNEGLVCFVVDAEVVKGLL